jgi:hypothetical protein
MLKRRHRFIGILKRLSVSAITCILYPMAIILDKISSRCTRHELSRDVGRDLRSSITALSPDIRISSDPRYATIILETARYSVVITKEKFYQNEEFRIDVVPACSKHEGFRLDVVASVLAPEHWRCGTADSLASVDDWLAHLIPYLDIAFGPEACIETCRRIEEHINRTVRRQSVP